MLAVSGIRCVLAALPLLLFPPSHSRGRFQRSCCSLNSCERSYFCPLCAHGLSREWPPRFLVSLGALCLWPVLRNQLRCGGCLLRGAHQGAGKDVWTVITNGLYPAVCWLFSAQLYVVSLTPKYKKNPQNSQVWALSNREKVKIAKRQTPFHSQCRFLNKLLLMCLFWNLIRFEKGII